VELAEPVRLSQISVPQTDGGIEREFPQKEIVHPPEAELKILDISVDNVCVQGEIHPLL